MEEGIQASLYKRLLEDIRGLLGQAKAQAYKAVDNIRVQSYWQIGERIAREELKHKNRATYSKRIIEKLAEDLGFSRAVLYRILQFYKTYPIVVTLSRQLSWSHYEVLIALSSREKREYYEQQVMRNCWSVRELRRQVNKRLFERKGKAALPATSLAVAQPFSPDEVFKESYNFEFLKLSGAYDEQEMERALLLNVEKLLLEFGADFSLAGRQRKLTIDRQIHTIDLEFFHRGIPCIVLVELKIGKFKGEYAGQMNKYLNYYKENRKYPSEKDPIGLIICEGRGQEEVYYALGDIKNRIFVAEYKIKLPSEKDIAERLKKIKVHE